jgi:hypothetical protein
MNSGSDSGFGELLGVSGIKSELPLRDGVWESGSTALYHRPQNLNQQDFGLLHLPATC